MEAPHRALHSSRALQEKPWLLATSAFNLAGAKKAMLGVHGHETRHYHGSVGKMKDPCGETVSGLRLYIGSRIHVVPLKPSSRGLSASARASCMDRSELSR